MDSGPRSPSSMPLEVCSWTCLLLGPPLRVPALVLGTFTPALPTPAHARQSLDPSHVLHPLVLLSEREADTSWTLSVKPLLGSFFSVPATLHRSTGRQTPTELGNETFLPRG